MMLFFHVVLIIHISLIQFITSSEIPWNAVNNTRKGHPDCPCLSSLTAPPDLSVALKEIGPARDFNNYSTYGLGCAAHDMRTRACTEGRECENFTDIILPTSRNCDFSWCERMFCYVDPFNCKLLNRPSLVFPNSNRFFSYATCGDADIFSRYKRFESLNGNVLKVGINSNSGGWKGAYTFDKVHFEGPARKWYGPIVDFMNQASLRGNFSLLLTNPDASLRNKSDNFFQQNSTFDFCVYATGLGFLDLCIAQYTITDQRALSTEWMILGNDALHLIVINEAIDSNSWDSFINSIGTIFRPFTLSTWMFMLFIVIPTLGCLMIVHEFGRSGSTYPKVETVVLKYRNGTEIFKEQKVPMWKAFVKSFYISLLSVLQSSYEQSVVTVGAMLNLLGISFFILTIISVYTANLAAILTKTVERTAVTSFQDAVALNFRYCAERKNMKVVTDIFPNINAKQHFVKDPIALGGDGEPGFNCATCGARARTFDMIDPVRAMTDENYCHAGIGPIEDLEILQAGAFHCNKTAVGAPIRAIPLGIPISSRVHQALGAFLMTMTNEGLYEKALIAGKPALRCSKYEFREGSSLGIYQLSGIWVVSFGFAILGLIYTGCEFYYKHKIRKERFEVMRLHKRDQRGTRISSFRRDPQWVSERLVGSKTDLESVKSSSKIHRHAYDESSDFPENTETACETMTINPSVNMDRKNHQVEKPTISKKNKSLGLNESNFAITRCDI